MKASRTVLLVLAVLVIAAIALAGCGGSTTTIKTTPLSEPGYTDVPLEQAPAAASSMQQQAQSMTRQANLRTIDAAIQMYLAETGQVPTSVQQLVPNYLMKVPVDPMGGTYYIVSQNGQPAAAVK